MEMLLERVLIELVAIALQIALVRLYRWWRSRTAGATAQPDMLAAA